MGKNTIYLLDVRNDDEREDPGRIPGSLHVPRKFDYRKFAFRKCSLKNWSQLRQLPWNVISKSDFINHKAWSFQFGWILLQIRINPWKRIILWNYLVVARFWCWKFFLWSSSILCTKLIFAIWCAQKKNYLEEKV